MGEFKNALASARSIVHHHEDGGPPDVDPELLYDLCKIFRPYVDFQGQAPPVNYAPITLEEHQRRNYLLFSAFSKYSPLDINVLLNSEINDDGTLNGLYMDVCGSLLVVPEAEKQDQCPICLDVYGSNKHMRILSCGHKFHPNCGYEWMLRKTLCPICRIGLTLNPKTPID